MTSYSLCQSVLNPEKVYNPYIHFLAGAIAGGIGSAVTMPLDVCKTLLNTQEAAVLKQLHKSKVGKHLSLQQRICPFLSLCSGGRSLGRRAYNPPSGRLPWLLPGPHSQGAVPGPVYRGLLVRLRVLQGVPEEQERRRWYRLRHHFRSRATQGEGGGGGQTGAAHDGAFGGEVRVRRGRKRKGRERGATGIERLTVEKSFDRGTGFVCD